MANLGPETRHNFDRSTVPDMSTSESEHLAGTRRFNSLRKVAALACVSLVALVASDSPKRAQQENFGAGFNNSTSANWAGFKALNPGAFNYIKEKYVVVPELDCSTSGYYDATSWVGFETTDGTLYQTGIGASCDSGVASFRDWWEDYPNELEQSFGTSETPQAGDEIEETALVNQYGVEFFVDDYGNNGVLKWGDSKQLYDGVTYSEVTDAECITERPSFATGGYKSLANFGTLEITSPGCDMVAGAQDHFISSNYPRASRTEYDMYNSSGNPLVITSAPISSGAYTETWEASS